MLLKRLLVGRPFRSDKLTETLLPKRIALPVFASDPMSSVAYAPGELMGTLALAGAATYVMSPWVGLVVVAVLLVVVASYRQNVRAYPSGGGDYEVANTNLGSRYGLVVASALLVDYVLTVAVSVASGIQNLGAAIPLLQEQPVVAALLVVALLTAMNLRGIRESGALFAVPTYLFIGTILLMILYGLFRLFVLGDDVRAESAEFGLKPVDSFTGLAFVFLLMRGFSSGCAALTGVEAISNGVPAFRKPKSENAAKTLLMLGVIAVTMMMGTLVLARLTGVKYVDPTEMESLIGAPADYVQKPVLAQLGEAVFSAFPAGFYLVTAVTALILLLAANTAFSGFPVLGSILAQDRYLPRQLHTRGDRLAFSNGILFLAVFAGVLLVAFQANPSQLIHLYIVGVFVSFTLSQIGMVRHWTRLLKVERDAVRRGRMVRARIINSIGMVMTGTVLIIVLITKFTQGAWIAIVAMVLIYLLMLGIRRHYDSVVTELELADEKPVLPSRNHAVVLLSKLHQPAMRALAYARATRPDTLTAVTVNVDDTDTRALQAEWQRRDIPIPLAVVDSPYREITQPILKYVKGIQRESPRDVITVFIPEYVVGHWWENLLHNQSALRLKGRLLFEPGVMVTSVPWQLASTEGRDFRRQDKIYAKVRRGLIQDGKDTKEFKKSSELAAHGHSATASELTATRPTTTKPTATKPTGGEDDRTT